MLIHWGVVPRGAPADSWTVPAQETWPRGTMLYKQKALQTPMMPVQASVWPTGSVASAGSLVEVDVTVLGTACEALRFCREAVTIEGYNPDIRCNLGRVLMRAGRRKEAHQAFTRGLSLQPDHQDLIKALRKLGVRKRPVVPFLGRSHPVNVFLGRMRAARAA